MAGIKAFEGAEADVHPRQALCTSEWKRRSSRAL